MKVNEEIYDILREYGIRRNEGLTALLSVYYDCIPDYLPEVLMRKLNATGIVVNGTKGLEWKVQLFEGQETEFEWVKTEYVELFKRHHPKGTNLFAAEATRRMKKFFAKHPSIRKDDVIRATREYLNTATPGYTRLPHYFISKGKGADKIEPLLGWVDKIKEKGKRPDNNVIPDKNKLQ